MARQWIQTQDLVPAAMREQTSANLCTKILPCVVVHGDDILRRKLAEFECTISDIRGEINTATSSGFSAQVNACTSV